MSPTLHLPQWTQARQHWAKVYTERLSGVPDLSLPTVAVGREPVWHLFVVAGSLCHVMAVHHAPH